MTLKSINKFKSTVTGIDATGCSFITVLDAPDFVWNDDLNAFAMPGGLRGTTYVIEGLVRENGYYSPAITTGDTVYVMGVGPRLTVTSVSDDYMTCVPYGGGDTVELYYENYIWSGEIMVGEISTYIFTTGATHNVGEHICTFPDNSVEIYTTTISSNPAIKVNGETVEVGETKKYKKGTELTIVALDPSGQYYPYQDTLTFSGDTEYNIELEATGSGDSGGGDSGGGDVVGIK